MKRTSLLLRTWMELRTRMLLSAMTILALALTGTTVLAAGPPGKDNLTVEAKDSYGSEGSVSPTVPGNAQNQWFYLFTLSAGESLHQTFPVDFTLNEANGTSPETATVNLNPVGSLMDFVTNISGAETFSISDTEGKATKEIEVTTGFLPEGTYALNIQIAATPANKVHLSHNTIHILVVVDGNCAGLHTFLTDNEFTTIVTSTIVNVAKGKKDPEPRVVSTNPYGQLSYNVLFVNQCSADQTFNLAITLDSHFETNPRNNPGNAVFTYLVGTTIDPAEFDIQDFGDGTGQRQNLWFTDITVPSGYSFLVTVHIQIIKGQWLSELPVASYEPPPPAGIFDGFSAQLYTPSTTLSSLSTGTGILAPLVQPNPSESDLSFTVQ